MGCIEPFPLNEDSFGSELVDPKDKAFYTVQIINNTIAYGADWQTGAGDHRRKTYNIRSWETGKWLYVRRTVHFLANMWLSMAIRLHITDGNKASLF